MRGEYYLHDSIEAALGSVQVPGDLGLLDLAGKVRRLGVEGHVMLVAVGRGALVTRLLTNERTVLRVLTNKR